MVLAWCAKYNVAMKFKKISAVPTSLRKAYLDSIAQPQELFLENLVSKGTPWILGDSAYAIVYDEVLVEFFVNSDLNEAPIATFDAVMDASGVNAVLCKSFDKQLLFAAFARRCRVSSPGLLYRSIRDDSHTTRSDVSMRKGSVADIEAVMSINHDFFENIQELQGYADSGGLQILEKEGDVIGCGIAKQVIDTRPEVDIGMMVSAQHRKNGYGAYIVSFLKDYYLKQGIRPICGCGSENVGSQRALAKAGFVSEYRILKIAYP